MRAFPDFRADMIDNFVPPGEKCTLRVAVANVIFPDDVCEAVKLSNIKYVSSAPCMLTKAFARKYSTLQPTT